MDDVQQVLLDDADEAWERMVDDRDVRGVEAIRIDDLGGWQVAVAVMEFVREDPLESELRQRIAGALRSVRGVESAEEEDREVWFVSGSPSGQALVQAVSGVLDEFADQTRVVAGGSG
jgi:hypothetical protein